MYNRKVLFIYFAVFYLIAQNFKRLGIFGSDYYSARVAVNAVCKGGAKAVFFLGIVFALIVKLVLNSCNKRIVILVFIGVNKQALLLVG